jgi:hypothetical protein
LGSLKTYKLEIGRQVQGRGPKAERPKLEVLPISNIKTGVSNSQQTDTLKTTS